MILVLCLKNINGFNYIIPLLYVFHLTSSLSIRNWHKLIHHKHQLLLSDINSPSQCTLTYLFCLHLHYFNIDHTLEAFLHINHYNYKHGKVLIDLVHNYELDNAQTFYDTVAPKFLFRFVQSNNNVK